VRKVAIAGTGSYLPKKVLSNYDLEKMVDTTNEWIITRTGISERHIASDSEATSDLCAEAARRALRSAGVAPSDVGMIIVATITPDMFFPSTACLTQQAIGAQAAFCMDVSAACSGFIYAMETARLHVGSGRVENALVIGGETLSRVTDWTDRSTCVLFGDGAGAVVLKPAARGGGILGCSMGSDGRLWDLLKIPAGGSRMPASHETVDARLHTIKMEGREVFKHAVKCMTDACVAALRNAGLRKEDIAWIIPHQANQRIISAIAERLEFPMEKVYVNLNRVGNMSGASVPVALDELVAAGRVCRGDRLLFVAFGGGFTWGATVVEWE